MWSFKIGHSTLQVMLMMLLVLMVCSTPLYSSPTPSPRKMILENIEATVEMLLKEAWKNVTVVKPVPNLHNCPDNFFCLAEKVAEKAMEENVETNKLSTLNTDFKKYNTLCSTSCKLEKKHTCHIKKFLHEVKSCAVHFINRKPQKKEMNNTER